VIARSDEFYTGLGGPLYAVHPNGSIYAIFSGANEALDYWRGLDARGRSIFYIENAKGERVVLKDGSPGHAYSILDTLAAAECRKDSQP
jgi:hypothetical protein